jgi:hypothetical protein
MATRKKIPSKTPPTAAEFTAVLEDLHSKFNVFGEALHGVRDELRGEMRSKFNVFGEALHGVRDELRGEMRSHFKVFGESLQGVRDHVQALDGRVKMLTDDVKRVRDQVQALDGRLTDDVKGVRDELQEFRTDVDHRFARVEHAILDHGREIKPLRGGLENVRGELGEVRATVTRIETALATKVDRHEVEPIVERALARR